MQLYAAFTNGTLDPDMKDAVVLGPFDPEYIELTYLGLRSAPNGDHIAVCSINDGCWRIVTGVESVDKAETINLTRQWHTPILGDTPYSDIAIYWKEE